MLAAHEFNQNTSRGSLQATDDGGQALRRTSSRTVRVCQEQGLHLRPCSAIVRLVGKHRAHVTVRQGGRSADAASIFDLLSLAAPLGSELVLSAEGADAEEALDAVAGVFA